MQITMGMDVLSANGDKIGSVEKVVVDSSTKSINKIIVSSGMINKHHKIVDIDMVRDAGNGLRIDLNQSQFDELPDFVQERFTTADNDSVNALPFAQPNAGGAGFYLFGAPNVGRGYEGSQDSFFDAAPADAPIIEDRSNLLDTDVVITEGTDVIGSDGEKVGTVDEIVYAEDGTLSGFVVKAGFLLTHDVRVPINWVAETGGKHIRLNVPAAEAESKSFDIEEQTL